MLLGAFILYVLYTYDCVKVLVALAIAESEIP